MPIVTIDLLLIITPVIDLILMVNFHIRIQPNHRHRPNYIILLESPIDNFLLIQRTHDAWQQDHSFGTIAVEPGCWCIGSHLIHSLFSVLPVLPLLPPPLFLHPPLLIPQAASSYSPPTSSQSSSSSDNSEPPQSSTDCFVKSCSLNKCWIMRVIPHLVRITLLFGFGLFAGFIRYGLRVNEDVGLFVVGWGWGMLGRCFASGGGLCWWVVRLVRSFVNVRRSTWC